MTQIHTMRLQPDNFDEDFNGVEAIIEYCSDCGGPIRCDEEYVVRNKKTICIECWKIDNNLQDEENLE